MSIFPTKILFATDGSRDAVVAATTAVGLARATGSELHMVTAAEEYPHYEAYWPLAERSRQLAQEILHKQLKRIEKLGGTVDQNYLRIGTAAEEVVSLAEEIGAGLIVVGSRGRGGVRRALTGSVSDAVVRHAHCTVMVVRAQAVLFPTKLLVATDRSREAQLAATTAADLAKSTNSELHIVHVGLDQFRDEAQRELDTETSMVRETGVTNVQAHLKVGIPATMIVELAEELGVGLIAMGSRGRGGIRRALIGSVSAAVVPHAHCPVVVVRPE